MVAQGSLQQSTDDATSDQIANLQFQIVDLQLEIAAKGIDLGFMKASFDNLFTAAGRLQPEAQIGHLGRLVRLQKKHLA
jgi:hypothetical protein